MGRGLLLRGKIVPWAVQGAVFCPADSPLTWLTAVFFGSLVLHCRPGRHLGLSHSEADILDALDAACDSLAPGKRAACMKLLTQQRRDLEDFLFNKDIELLDMHLCTDIASLCTSHEVHSAGEL